MVGRPNRLPFLPLVMSGVLVDNLGRKGPKNGSFETEGEREMRCQRPSPGYRYWMPVLGQARMHERSRAKCRCSTYAGSINLNSFATHAAESAG